MSGECSRSFGGGKRTEVVEAAEGVWALQETELAYGKETGPKRAPCDCFNGIEIGNLRNLSNLLW